MTNAPATPNVAYAGRDGAHSAAACEQLFPDGASLVSLPSFSAVAEAAAEGAVHLGVLPIESSLSGPVAETHDLLHDSALSITAETVLAIRHCLVGPAIVPLEQIRVVRSHPAALDQCRRLLAAMPWATAIAVGDDRRRGRRGRRPRGLVRGRHRERASGSAPRARDHRRRRRRPPRGLHALRRGRSLHAARPEPKRTGARRSAS